MGTGEEPVEFEPALVRTAIVVILGTIMSSLDQTVVNVAIPRLGESFHATLPTIQWVSTAYILALAVSLPPTRWVMDRFGAKRAWMVSVFLFVLGSVCCGLSWSPTSLIAFRVLQGLGGGMILPIGQTLISRAAGAHRMGRVMSIVQIPTLLGPLAGPVLGGFILLKLSWRWIFFVNVPVCLVALPLAAAFLARDEEQASTERLDVPSLLLLSPGLALVVYGLAQFGNAGLGVETAVAIGVGVAVIAAFVWRALRIERPLLDLRLFRVSGYLTSSLVIFFFGAGIFGSFVAATLYYQVGRGFSPFASGLLQGPLTFSSALVLPFAGRITDRFGPRRLVVGGLAISALGTVVLTQLRPDTSIVLIVVTMVVRGIGMGCTFTPSMAAGFAALRSEELGAGATLQNIVQRIASTFGVALLAVVFQRSLSAEFGGRNVPLSAVPTHGPAHDAIAPALSSAFSWTFFVVLLLGLVAALPAMRLPREPVRPHALPEIEEEPVEVGAVRSVGVGERVLPTDSGPTGSA